ncbi:TonB-dependent receptor [Zhongshania marina]|uniref:TonB-dependent receptor n=1 Tax=Zhongshania marina TaxID=2304603 RepID=A0ABX9W714_9GAMM|nr:TonB-dependent receptor [Zhongshania marina]
MLSKVSRFTMTTLAAAIAGLGSIHAQAQTEGAKQLEEVLVTAQRRSESQQDVPVAVTAASREDMALAQVDSIGNIQAISPSIKFDVTNSAANSANIFIRGIGTVGNNRSFEGAVGVFIDGVYRTRAGQAMQNWLDMESLQVLRGPQGTLFGKNTSAGALLISSRAPSLDSAEGDIELTLGNYNKQLLRGAYNMPTGERSALRVAGLWAERDGFIENPNGGDYNESAPRALKAQWLFEPSEALSLRMIADWSESDTNCCYGQVDAVDGPLQGYIDNVLIPARGLKAPSSNFDDYEQVLSNDTQQSISDEGLQLIAELELANGAILKSTTAYRRWEIEQIGMDADFSGANVLTINESLETEVFSQEFTLSGDMDGFGPVKAADYVMGVYYADEDIFANNELLWGDQAQEFFDTVIGVPGAVDASEGLWAHHHMPAESQSYAAFMHWNLDFSEQWGAAIGLRYSKDEKQGAIERVFFTSTVNSAFRAQGVQPGPTYDQDYSDSALSGSLALQYHTSDAVMAYASYSRGYKAGGVNIDNTAAGGVGDNPAEASCASFGDCVPNDPRYDSEFIDGYELGLKAEYLDRRARSNIALFYNDMKDLQVALFSGTAFSVINASDAEVYGAEIENQFLLNDWLSMNVDVTWLAEARFGEDASLGILSDREFAQAPELAGNLSFTVDQEISNDLSFKGRVAAIYSGEQYTNASNNLERDAETELNLSAGIHSESKGWSVTLWVQNATDERYVTQHFNSPLQGTDANAYVSAPRTYGVSFRAAF